ncbi:universal stress protein [Massilia varians]|uniref:universal stress protein n=1 Tax=Massilia varians TaxID=457921 RepID=UPI0025542B54|nr:universal stress protein [Massilia varians]
MNDSIPPSRLLLATDLCAHCDRPLDRAKQLALEWQSELVILTVREGPRTPDEVSAWLDRDATVSALELAARRELQEEFAGSGVAPTLQVRDGEVVDAIVDTAGTLGDGLVVTGASRDEGFQQLIFGSTTERLAQGLAQPLLVVRQRTRGAYARILVANDFSDASRRALETAVRLFPGRRIVLLHVLEALAEPVADAVPEMLAASERFLDGCALPPGARQHIAPFIGHGGVTGTIARYAHEHALQLVVLGVRERSSVARVFMGSRSDDLLLHLACDTLLVRAPEGGVDG